MNGLPKPFPLEIRLSAQIKREAFHSKLAASPIAVLRPKAGVKSMNMISSAEGFSVFKNWKTQSTPLWCFSLDTADFATRLEAKVSSFG